jgi:hypothetical protein
MATSSPHSVPVCFRPATHAVRLWLNGARADLAKGVVFAQRIREEVIHYGEGNTYTLNAGGVLESLPPILEQLGVTERAWLDFVSRLQETYQTVYDALGIAPAFAPFLETVTLGAVTDGWEAWGSIFCQMRKRQCRWAMPWWC